jgi:hypothetical protein
MMARWPGDWVGEERTTDIIRANFEGLKKYKNLTKAVGYGQKKDRKLSYPSPRA